MFGTEFIRGQGLGNQLFCYVSARCIAQKNNYDFGILNQNNFAMNIHNNKGMYFMDIDLGKELREHKKMKTYNEKEKRYLCENSFHDISTGCYIAGTDKDIMELPDDTVIYGNLQAEDYFETYKKDIKEWLKVKKEYDSYEFCQDDLCILNMRGGEYIGSWELLLKKKYWLNAMKMMRKINPDMRFIIITDDTQYAKRVFHNIPAYHFTIEKDYVSIKNARYVILSNSSFAFFPVYTSDTIRFIIAPKYWARHNVSDGYWSSEQNIYKDWNYMDRKGCLFSYDECKNELEKYKEKKNMEANETKKFGICVKLYINIKIILGKIAFFVGIF